MAQRIQIALSVSKKTASALSKGSPVKLDTDADYVVTSTSSNDAAIFGVLKDDSVAGGTVEVIRLGVAPVKIKTASGIAVGDFIMQSDTAGKAIEVAAVAGTNYFAFARVDEAPGSNDDLVTCGINAFMTPIQG
jgi:hypothetical protein